MVDQSHAMAREDYLWAFTVLFSTEMFNILDELKVPFLHFIPGNQYHTVINWFTEQSGMTFDELLEPYCRQVYAGYWEVKWEEVGPGTIVYIDSFQHGKKPFARPRICGPYQVLDPKDKLLLTTWKVGLPSEMRRGEGTFKTLHPRPDEPILIKTPAVDTRLAQYWKWLTEQEIRGGHIVGTFDFFGMNASLKQIFDYIEYNWHVQIDRKAFPELVLFSNK